MMNLKKNSYSYLYNSESLFCKISFMKKTLIIMGLTAFTQLNAEIISNSEIHNVCNHIKEKLSDIEWVKSVVRYKKELELDINNDGKTEILKTHLRGTMGIQESNFINSSAEVIELSKTKDINDGTFGDSFHAINFQGKNFILYCSEGCKNPKYLEIISGDNKFHRLCEFDQSIIEVNKTESKFCTSLMGDNSNRYVSFNGEILFDRTKFYRWSSAYRGTNSIDLNFDGMLENLVYVSYSGSSGRGCGYDYFDLLTSDGSAIDEEGDLRNKLLAIQGVSPGSGKYSHTSTPYCSGNDIGWFIQGGQLYFEYKYSGSEPYHGALFHKVIEFHENGYTEACNFNFETKFSITKTY